MGVREVACFRAVLCVCAPCLVQEGFTCEVTTVPCVQGVLLFSGQYHNAWAMGSVCMFVILNMSCLLLSAEPLSAA